MSIKNDDLFDPSAVFVRSELIKEILYVLFNSPEKDMKFIHVAGTNGKGSVSTMISSILIENGYKTGLFTSPSVKSFMERIKVNNVPMPFDEYKVIREKIVKNAPKIMNKKFNFIKNLSEFTITTIAAMNYFKEKNCDVAVLEAGIGGFKDSTNVIDSNLISIITSISFDHVQTLGDTIEKIAFQKSGIIKKGRPVVVSAGQDQIVYDIIQKTAEKNESEMIIPKQQDIELISSDLQNGTKFKYKGKELKINLLGEHQIENVLTVLTAVARLRNDINISDDAIKSGLEKAFINARLEILSKKPLIILDGAHNESGIRSLSAFIEKYMKDRKLFGILGMCQDKNSDSEFQKIIPMFSEIIPVEIPRFPRSMPLDRLTKIVSDYSKNVHPFKDPAQAIEYCIKNSTSDSAVVIFGSLYLARRIIRNPEITAMMNNDNNF